LPAFRTWRRVRRLPRRLELRQQCARAVLRPLMDAGVFKQGHIPRAWRRVAGVRRDGTPV
jgi:hypothetical protein